MSAASSPPLDGLDPTGWAVDDERGEIVGGQLRSKGGTAYFKHSRPLQPADVLRMRVQEGREAWMGFAGAGLDVEKFGETCKSTAMASVSNGTTIIYPDLSLDGQRHCYHGHLRLHIPKAPFDLALRCETVSSVPQIQFNDDDVWHVRTVQYD